MASAREEAKKEILRLREEIEKHNRHYYVVDNPVISDAEYDRLFRRLVELEKKYKFTAPDSPTQKVGAPPLEKFGTVRHSLPMLSLNNANNREEMEEFEERIRGFLKIPQPVEYSTGLRNGDQACPLVRDLRRSSEFLLINKSKLLENK